MPVCFVIMGFGQKTDLATGRVLDLDKSYRNIIKPAVIAAGYECIRADEVQHSGVIDVPMYEMLFEADLVVADLSTANLNAIFELGVRHALKPRGTIIIAERYFTIPFDANHIVVRHYEHLGPDIGFDEAMRMQKVLTDLINALKGKEDVDSPVYTVILDLEGPRRGKTTTPNAPAQSIMAGGDTYAAKLQTARAAMDGGSFAPARKILQEIYEEQTAPGVDGKSKQAPAAIVQQLALATYKAGEARAKAGSVDQALAGYKEAEDLLRQLDVGKTTDPETLRLWSEVHKQRAEIATRLPGERRDDLIKAIDAAEKAFIIGGDYASGMDLAYVLSLAASMSSGDQRIAYNFRAEEYRRKALEEGGQTARVYGIERSIQTKYYVSYAWADHADPNREKDVDRLCDEAERQGVKIFRDKKALSTGGIISDFMRQIGEGDRVFIFLSDKYLRSPYCMFELFELWRNSRQNKEEFLRRVRFFTIDGTKIQKPSEWLEYAKFWKRERDELRQAIDEAGLEFAGEEAPKRFRLVGYFASSISDVLAYFADVVQPRTFDEFVKFGFDGQPAAERMN
jgi:hypothetical protein